MLTFYGEELNTTTFSDNTTQVWQLSSDFILKCIESGKAELSWEFESVSEVFLVCQWADLMRNYGVKDINVIAPYLPYGRQDKAPSNETTFGLNTLVKVLKASGVNRLTTIDAHSDYANKVNEYFELYSLTPLSSITNALVDFNPDIVCFPDYSAKSRYYSLIKKVEWEKRDKNNPGLTHCYFRKQRDQVTGKIKEMELVSEPDSIEGMSVIMVDDICDAGGTFLWATSILKEHGAGEIGLYTTHGIYSAGKFKLYDGGISKLYNRKGIEGA